MKQQYSAVAARQLQSLKIDSVTSRALKPKEVRVKVAAVTLNYRDLMILKGSYGLSDISIVPASDGAGEVIEVGSEVSHWKLGDRVMASFFPNWHDGPATSPKLQGALGQGSTGMLSRIY